MTLPNKEINAFGKKLEAVYGPTWRTECAVDTGYTYQHLWRIATGRSEVPLLLGKYIDIRLSRKRGKKK